jgi:hypothetical protein
MQPVMQILENQLIHKRFLPFLEEGGLVRMVIPYLKKTLSHGQDSNICFNLSV